MFGYFALPQQRVFRDRWAPPKFGKVKINVDGGIFHEECFGGIGVIFRDHNGFFLAAKAQRFDGVSDVLQIEAQHGLFLAKSLGYRLIELESDSTTLVTPLLF